MAGQVSQIGSMELINTIGGIVPPAIVDGSANYPATWTPGLVVIDYSASPPALMVWNGSTWVAGPETLYVALLTGDPSVAGQDGGYAETVADIAACEDTTTGYERVPVTFGPVVPQYSATAAYTVGQQVQYQGFVYACATATTGNAPAGTESSNTYWTYVPNGGYPAQIGNTNVLTWGPYTAAQTLPVQWAALVTSSSGTSGLLKYTWTLPEQQQVSISQSIQAGVGSLILGES